jgi:hypothetical protein
MNKIIFYLVLVIGVAHARTPANFTSPNPEKMDTQLLKFFNHFYNGKGELFVIAKDRNEEPMNYSAKNNNGTCEYQWESERMIVQSDSMFGKYINKLGIKADMTLGSYKLKCTASWKADQRFSKKGQCINNLREDYILSHQTCSFGKVNLFYDKYYFPNMYQAAKVWQNDRQNGKQINFNQD